ncbi:hypothetical protein [Streptomyces sp. NBC_01304]|uniref:hypothetical protein n=1 Tax=Streptomyces sp. NBC_01304 TaxID=2903818 RepID=UPI002E0E3D59|nr:hypothetical protein OG430_08155 [Streptomyces sp. NBC_01304]
MRRTNLTGPEGAWTGLLIEVTGRPRPSLCLHTAGEGRLLLGQAGVPLLLAAVSPGLHGVDFRRLDTFRPPVPPVRADLARRHRGVAERWAHHFAAALSDGANGPLHDGRWILSAHTPLLRSWNRHGAGPAEYWGEALVQGHPDGDIDWWFPHAAPWPVCPLRPMPGPDDARVKAYRKQAREGTLPPVLLWWVTGLQSLVPLDGHARLAAALAEDIEPPLLVLHRAAPPDELASGTHEAATAYETELARWAELRATHGPRIPDGTEQAGHALARRLTELHTGHRPTWAWPLPGGSAAWERIAAEHAPHLLRGPRGSCGTPPAG